MFPRTYNSGDGFELRAEFEDAAESPTYPQSAKWRVVCVTNETVLQDWTVVPVQTDLDDQGNVLAYYALIDVPGTLNVLQNTANAKEAKKVEIAAELSGARQYSDEYAYYVRRRQ